MKVLPLDQDFYFVEKRCHKLVDMVICVVQVKILSLVFAALALGGSVMVSAKLERLAEMKFEKVQTISKSWRQAVLHHQQTEFQAPNFH